MNTEYNIQSQSGNSVWDDLLINSGLFKFAGSSDPVWGNWQITGGTINFRVLQFDLNDQIFFTCQLPHTYKEGTNLRCHVHWTPRALGAAHSGDAVGWKLDYSWANINGDPFPAESSVSMLDTCSGTNEFHEVSAGLTELDGTGKTISSMLVGRLYRDSTGDTWGDVSHANSPALLQFDLHHEIDGQGSRLEWVKKP